VKGGWYRLTDKEIIVPGASDAVDFSVIVAQKLLQGENVTEPPATFNSERDIPHAQHKGD
jgi:hypothetical protein